MKTNNRMEIVDLWRFVFCLIIMAFHMQNFELEGNFHFNIGWAFVEFYFLLTGYFTARHFVEKQKYDVINYPAASSMDYVINKFKYIMHFSTIVILVQYIVTAIRFNLSSWDLVLFFGKMPIEILMLSATGLTKTQIQPLWYLSAMFITLPFICYLLIKKRDLFMNILCWVIPVIYYGFIGVEQARQWPNDFLRAFAAMSIGVLVYVLSEMFKKYDCVNWFKILLTIVEIGCFVGAIAIAYMRYPSSYLRVIWFLMILGCIIMFSQRSYTADLHGGFLRFLGRLSLPLYLCQSTVGRLVSIWFSDWTFTNKAIIYYAITLIYSLILLGVVNLLRKDSDKKYENIKLLVQKSK